MKIIENAIALFSPELAFKRSKFNAAIEAVRKYDAAARGRRTAGWFSQPSSANTENKEALHLLRQRSREMVRNNPFAKRAIDVIGTNTVGDGIRCVPKVTKGRKSDSLKNTWLDWAETTICDYDNQHNFYGLQKLAMRAVAEGGECLIRVRNVPASESKFGIKLQLLEGDYLDEFRDKPILQDGGYIMQGIEFDKDSKVRGYWMFERHPAEVFVARSFVSKFVPADKIIHIYWKERLGQVRGVPFGTAAMLRLHDFDDYEDAQLMRQKIAACFSVFITDSAETLPTANAGSVTENPPERVEPGTIERLAPGKTVTFANPPGTDGYSDYSRKILQGGAAGYGVSYEAMTGDLSNVNFSSGRMGWLEFHRLVTDWQANMIIPMMCDKVFEKFIKSVDIAGLYTGEAKAQWTTPRREMIDPVKEIKGLSEEVRNGFKSWQEAVRELGYEPSEILKQLQDDHKSFKDSGLMPLSDPSFDANRPIPVLPGATKD